MKTLISSAVLGLLAVPAALASQPRDYSPEIAAHLRLACSGSCDKVALQSSPLTTAMRGSEDRKPAGEDPPPDP
jgi:hypothetical protein